MPCDLGQGAGQFHPGGAAADHGETEPGGLACGIGFRLGALEGEQQLAAQCDGIVQRFQARRIGGPFVVTEVGVGGAGAQHQRVVGDLRAIGQGGTARRFVDVGHFAKPHFNVALMAEDVAQRGGNIRCREAGGGHLVKQRLEQMVVATVHQGDAHVRRGEGTGGPEAGKTTTDDEQVGRGIAGHASLLGGRRRGAAQVVS